LTQLGWEFIDDITWLKPEASAKNRNAGFLQHRKPLAYKPNAITEMLMVYRKKTDKLIDWNIDQYPNDIVEASKVKDGYETSNVWRVDPTFDRTHSAVFPRALCERVIDYYSMRGDLVFDPFAGSGTIGKVALEQKRLFLLTEIDKSYFVRIKENLDSPSLFDSSPVRFISLEQFKENIANGN
jgi:DNA modification methylase